MRWRWAWSVFAALAFVAGCATSPSGIMPSFESSQPSTAWDSRPEGRAWTQAAADGIDQNAPTLLTFVPGDIAAFCPRYSDADAAQRRAFWVALLSQIAQTESGLDPAAQKGSRQGLFLISPVAAKSYGCDGDMKDPAMNIACAVRILNASSGRDHLVSGYASGAGWRGAARYWLSLRQPENLADLQARVNEQSFCPGKPKEPVS